MTVVSIVATIVITIIGTALLVYIHFQICKADEKYIQEISRIEEESRKAFCKISEEQIKSIICEYAEKYTITVDGVEVYQPFFFELNKEIMNVLRSDTE